MGSPPTLAHRALLCFVSQLLTVALHKFQYGLLFPGKVFELLERGYLFET